MKIKKNKLYNMNHSELFQLMLGNCVDMVVTSPPYGKLRKYDGYEFDFPTCVFGLWKVIKPGGVVVWVVGDQVVDGSETGDCYRQAMQFKSLGFRLHDTMIYMKESVLPNNDGNRYEQMFEYMFVFSKGAPKTANLLLKKNKTAGEYGARGSKESGSSLDGGNPKQKYVKAHTTKEYGTRGNVWTYGTGCNKSTKDRVAFIHPAIFPEQLAADHILTWSNPGDLVFDPMAGSGTVGKMAALLDRDWLMCEVSEKYCTEIIPLRMPSLTFKREEMIL